MKKKKRRKRHGRPFYTFSVFLIVLLFVGLALAENMILHPMAKVDLSGIDSEYAILVDAGTGFKLAGKAEKEQMYPASMTKIMTAILALEKCPDLDETMTVPSDIFDAIYSEQASTAGFEAGEVVTVRDLLYGVMLPSGAECCLTLARGIAGSEEAYAELMNQKAKKIGMRSTHFVNCTGLHNDDHYSTAKDIAKLLRYALKNVDFRAIFTSQSHAMSPTNVHPDGFTVYSTMFRALGDRGFTGGQLLGGKTGNTFRAGLCLASLAEVKGMEYILVTAKAEDAGDAHVTDALKVYGQIGEQ